MIVRTATVDELITKAVESEGVDLVVNLAAGLDARPYRMKLPPRLTWVEVDYPQSIEYKTKVLADETPQCRLERIGADLADENGRRLLFGQINRMGTKGLVITQA